VRYTLAAYEATFRDAITQYLETNGRAYFRNAGGTRNRGVEAGLTASVTTWLDASVAWTESRFRFTRYLAPRTATVTDTLDGKRVAARGRSTWSTPGVVRFTATTATRCWCRAGDGA
jgi:hypothetical protein